MRSSLQQGADIGARCGLMAANGPKQSFAPVVILLFSQIDPRLLGPLSSPEGICHEQAKPTTEDGRRLLMWRDSL